MVRVDFGDYKEEVILINTEYGYRAYINRCRHLPVSLDWGDGEVLDASGKMLECRTHGALYRMKDGLCVAGPCQGAPLARVDLEERDGSVYLANSDSSDESEDVI